MLGRQHLNPNVLQANSCLEFVFETFNNFGYRPMASDTAHRFEICKKFACLNLRIGFSRQKLSPSLFCLQESIDLIGTKKGIWKKKRDTAFGDSSQKAIAWRDRGERFLFTIARMFQHWTFKKQKTKLSWRAELSVGWKFSGNITRVLTCTKKKKGLSLAYQHGAEASCCIVCWAIPALCRLIIQATSPK